MTNKLFLSHVSFFLFFSFPKTTFHHHLFSLNEQRFLIVFLNKKSHFPAVRTALSAPWSFFLNKSGCTLLVTLNDLWTAHICLSTGLFPIQNNVAINRLSISAENDPRPRPKPPISALLHTEWEAFAWGEKAIRL